MRLKDPSSAILLAPIHISKRWANEVALFAQHLSGGAEVDHHGAVVVGDAEQADRGADQPSRTNDGDAAVL